VVWLSFFKLRSGINTGMSKAKVMPAILSISTLIVAYDCGILSPLLSKTGVKTVPSKSSNSWFFPDYSSAASERLISMIKSLEMEKNLFP